MVQEFTGDVIAKAHYTHDAMVDMIIQNPSVTQRDLARHFGYTESWISQIIRCDVIREKLTKRSNELLDPIALLDVQRRFEALAHRSMDVLFDQLDMKANPEVALKALEITSRSLGYGAKAPGVQINQQFVVAMPPKAESSDSWAAQYKPHAGGAVNTGHSHTITVDTVIDG